MEFLLTLLVLLLCAKVFGELLHHLGFSALIGTAMCSRGSLELAMLQFGFLSLRGYGFTPELFAVMVVTTLATTLLTPLLFRYVSRGR